MRIAFVAQPLDLVRPPVQNSLGIFVYEVARRLARRHEVIVYLYEGRWRFGETQSDGLRYRFVPVKVDRKLTRWVEKLGRSNDPRRPAFARSSAHAAYAHHIAADARRLGADVIHVLNYTQFLPIIRRKNPQARLVLHMQCEWLSQLDAEWMRPRAAAADRVLGCADFVAEQARKALPEFAERCGFLFNGADAEKFTPDGAGPRADVGDAPRLLFVARVSPEKGVHVLLEAFRKVRERYPNARLDVVGALSAAPREFNVDLSADPRTRQLARFYEGDYVQQMKAAAGEGVHFTGNLPYAELVSLYRQADVFVFPSVWHEPFGMPNIEAMACGVPVVSTRGGGIPEVVLDGQTGLLVERGNPDELAAAILRLLGDYELRQRFSLAGRTRVEERFSWDRIARDLEDEYRRLLGKGAPAGSEQAAQVAAAGG
jgi:glycosyltransferase involved in cell wall biosynthesis